MIVNYKVSGYRVMEWWIHLITGLGGALVGIGTSLVGLYFVFRKRLAYVRKLDAEARRLDTEIRSQEAGYLESQYQRQLERANTEIGRLHTQNDNQEERIQEQNGKIEELQTQNLKCLDDNRRVKTKLSTLELQVEQLRLASMTPIVAMICNVSADLDGVIIEADRNVKDVLGYTPEELIGKNVNIIIPREVRGKHHAGLERCKTSGLVRPADTAIQSFALTKDRDKIPVIVSLTGWVDENNKRFISAQIIHRRTFSIVLPSNSTGPLSPPIPMNPNQPQQESGIFKKKLPDATEGSK